MIDWGRVKDLRSEIGAEDFSDVVALFLEEADEVIARTASTYREAQRLLTGA